MTLAQWLSSEVYGVLLVFARVGTALMFIPAVGEMFVPGRIRLLFAIAMSWALAPLLVPADLALPQGPMGLFADLAVEVTAGLFFGLTTRLFLSALMIAGQIIAQIIGLSNIFVLPGMSMALGSVMGGFLMLTGLVFIFASGLHLLTLDALARTYVGLPMGGAPDLDGMASTFTGLVARIFRLAVEMAAPFLVLGFVYYVGLGLVNKAMQQLPVFFVSIPAAIAGGLVILMTVIAAMMALFKSAYAEWLTTLTL